MRTPFRSRVVASLSAAALPVGALLASAPAIGADPSAQVQTQDSAEFAIADGYLFKQAVCTPDLSPRFESIA